MSIVFLPRSILFQINCQWNIYKVNIMSVEASKRSSNSPLVFFFFILAMGQTQKLYKHVHVHVTMRLTNEIVWISVQHNLDCVLKSIRLWTMMQYCQIIFVSFHSSAELPFPFPIKRRETFQGFLKSKMNVTLVDLLFPLFSLH